MAPQLDSYFKQVDDSANHFIERLRKAVAIPSISAEDARRPDVVRMGEWLAGELKSLGAEVELRPLGKQPHKEHLDLPPVVLARYGNDKNKRTILVYGHYDVQPAEKSDGWATEPFELSVDDKGRMFGRGSTDDKGPVLGWLNAIEAHQKAGIDFPVNLLMCFEGMEEYGSEGLEEFIQAEAKKYFADTDAVCISDNYWLGTEKPCLTYGLRGCNYYSVEVSGPGADLHSGVFGGTAQEPMTDLVRILGSLVDTNGKIQIPGIMEQVAPITKEEEGLYDGISFTMDNIFESLGSKTTIHDDKKNTLMARWRYPSLSVHGVEGAFSSPGAKTVIPAKVIGKFSIRTVPNMDIDTTNNCVYKYVEEQFAKLNSKNTMKVYAQHTGKWWAASPKHWNFSAAAKATERVWGVQPDFTREGGSIPVTLTFEEATGKNVLLLPMGSSTDGAHSINEKLDKRNYIEGIKLLGAYLHYVAEEPQTTTPLSASGSRQNGPETQHYQHLSNTAGLPKFLAAKFELHLSPTAVDAWFVVDGFIKSSRLGRLVDTDNTLQQPTGTCAPDTLRCMTCSTDLALTSQIISKGFTGRYGRAFLVAPPPPPADNTTLLNIRIGRSEDRQLVTGWHVVADICCATCTRKLGWKYVDATEPSQKYKVGKYILETERVMSHRSWEDYNVQDLGFIGREGRDVEGRSSDEIVFDSDDDEECEDIFAGTWDAATVAKRRSESIARRISAMG
ncbi:glutamate carboxypeptidase [Metarhizium brunneum]